MHSAPSVSFPVGRSRLARRLLWGLWALGAVALAAWCIQFSGAPWRTALMGVVLAAAAHAAWVASRLGEGARLRWDGSHWSCDGAVRLGDAGVTVHLDLQSLVLVRLREPGGLAMWLWLERSSDPARWLDLRRALYAAAPSAAGQGVVQP